MRDVIPLNPDYDDDDEAWARQYWKGPIVLMHGMGDNVDDWVNHAYGPHLILPFLLADIGYEVWSCSGRGTYDYTSHTYMSAKDPKFWDYHYINQAHDDLSSIVQEAYKM